MARYESTAAKWRAANIIPQAGAGATGVTPGTYGDGTDVAQITVGADGRIRAVTNVAIAGAAPTGPAGGDLTGTYPNPTLAAAGGGAAGPTGGATAVPIVTVDAKGRVTALSSATIAIPESAVTNLTTDLAAKQATADFTHSLLLMGA